MLNHNSSMKWTELGLALCLTAVWTVEHLPESSSSPSVTIVCVCFGGLITTCMQQHLCFLVRPSTQFCCGPTCVSQAGAANLRQPGRAVRQTHEHHLQLSPQRRHRLLHHREQKHACTQPSPLPTWKPRVSRSQNNTLPMLPRPWLLPSLWTRWASLGTSVSRRTSLATFWWTSHPIWSRRWFEWVSWCLWLWDSPWWSCRVGRPSTPCSSSSRYGSITLCVQSEFSRNANKTFDAKGNPDSYFWRFKRDWFCCSPSCSRRMGRLLQGVTCHLCASRPSLSASSLAPCWEASSSPMVYSLRVCRLHVCMNSQARSLRCICSFMWAESLGIYDVWKCDFTSWWLSPSMTVLKSDP